MTKEKKLNKIWEKLGVKVVEMTTNSVTLQGNTGLEIEICFLQEVLSFKSDASIRISEVKLIKKTAKILGWYKYGRILK